MIYIDTNTSSAYRNFAIEYYFASEKQLDDTIFLFWNTTPTLMVGKFQNIMEEIDYNYAKNNNINIVRRMSGGGTIYTDLGGFQFSFIKYNDEQNINFTKFITPIVDFIKSLDIPVVFSGRNDLLINNKKFSGNAQYKVKKTTVHHGSLLFATNIEEMIKSTTVDPDKFSSKSIKSVRERVTNISEHLKKQMSIEDFKNKLINSIINENNKIYTLTKEDEKRISKIEKEYFLNWDNLFTKNPDFIMNKKQKSKAGLINIKLAIKKGIITDTQITGDFFAGENFNLLNELLIGSRLDKQELKHKFEKYKDIEFIYNISIDEIIDIIFM